MQIKGGITLQDFEDDAAFAVAVVGHKHSNGNPSFLLNCGTFHYDISFLCKMSL